MNCLMKARHQHEADLRGWLRLRFGNAADAEDVLQDLFIKALRERLTQACQVRPDAAGRVSDFVPRADEAIEWPAGSRNAGPFLA